MLDFAPYMLYLQIEANAVTGYMDFRRPVFASPAVTCANQLNVVTTCQSSTFAQPVNTPLHVTASIRCIQPNTVKSRAQAFEGKDTDVTKAWVPAKTVIGGNSHAAADASPSPVDVTVGSNLVVQPSKSVGHLRHTHVSPVRQRDKSPQFIFDRERSPVCQSPPLPVRRNFHPVHSVAGSEFVSSEMPSDVHVVAQRLKLFESKPVMSNKPALLPKPQSPRSDLGANRVSVFRSKSSDSVMQSDVGCTSFQDAAQSMANKSLKIPADDADMMTRCTIRQTKEIVVSPPLSLYPETSNIVSPRPSQKPQEKEVVGRPPSFSRKVKEVVVINSAAPVPSEAPKKPPRMTVVNLPSVTTTHDDSYGLLVYAAGAEIPSVHVENLSPDASVMNDLSLQIPDAPVSDHRGHLASRIRPRSMRETVLNTSRLQNSNAFLSNVALQPSSVGDAWEKKFIRAPRNTPVVCSKGEKENFVTKKRINNPTYMYVSVHVDDIIPSQQKVVADKQTLTRHHSDDMLNIPLAPRHSGMPAPKSPSYKEPLYSIPHDFAESSVKFDSAGYALPNVQDTAQFIVTNLSLLKFSCIEHCVITYFLLPLFLL